MNGQKCRGIDDPFSPQNGCYNGNDQISCIGIDDGRNINFLKMEQPTRDVSDYEQEYVDGNSRHKGQYQACLDFRLEVDLKSAEYHGRHH